MCCHQKWLLLLLLLLLSLLHLAGVFKPGTRVWGTYGNIFSAPLVGFRNCCCGQKEYQCGGGY